MTEATSVSEAWFQRGLAHGAPAVTAERERDLWRRWTERRDRFAANELVRAHLRNVTIVALRFRHYGVPVSDLIAEGNCGLLRALEKFDPERGVRFATYAAHWIRAYVIDYVMRSRSIVVSHSGPMRPQLYFKLRRERARAVAQLGEGEAAQAQLAERLGLRVERVRSLIERLDAADVSLDAPPPGGTTGLSELLTSLSNPEQTLASARWNHSLKDEVTRALSSLDPRERYVVEQRLMADGSRSASLAQIGRRFGVSRERARQIEARAKRKLRACFEHSADQGLAEWRASLG